MATEQIYPCIYGDCGYEFKTANDLRIHLENHSIGEKLNEQLATKTSTKVNEIIFPCDFCGEKFYGSNLLEGHLKDSHPINISPQRIPIESIKSKEILPLVILDLIKRSEMGEKKYGTPLKSFNGRNAFIDAYQEALDLVMYMRQTLDEWKEGE